jgi:acetone carboxylase beta subunit
VLAIDAGGTTHFHNQPIVEPGLAHTLVSGPIGGQALARELGIPNVLCTDIGGTSFDIALLTDGRFEITPTPDIARFVLNIPLVRIDSIGAGTGSFVSSTQSGPGRRLSASSPCRSGCRSTTRPPA